MIARIASNPTFLSRNFLNEDSDDERSPEGSVASLPLGSSRVKFQMRDSHSSLGGSFSRQGSLRESLDVIVHEPIAEDSSVDLGTQLEIMRHQRDALLAAFDKLERSEEGIDELVLQLEAQVRLLCPMWNGGFLSFGCFLLCFPS